MYCIRILSVNEDVELSGLDITEHGGSVYQANEFNKGQTIKVANEFPGTDEKKKGTESGDASEQVELVRAYLHT